MRQDPNPLFRRVIIPWYDSIAVCWIVLLAMLAVILFGCSGIWVALSREEFKSYIWMPGLIFLLGLLVFISNFSRMIRRYPEK